MAFLAVLGIVVDVLLAEQALEDYAQTSELHVYLKPLDAFGNLQSPRYANPPPSAAGSLASADSSLVDTVHSAVVSQSGAISILQQTAVPFGRAGSSPVHLHHRNPSKSDAVRKLIEENRLPPPLIPPSLSSSVSIENPYHISPMTSPTSSDGGLHPISISHIGLRRSPSADSLTSMIESSSLFPFPPSVATHDEMIFTPSPTPHDSSPSVREAQGYPPSQQLSTSSETKKTQQQQQQQQQIAVNTLAPAKVTTLATTSTTTTSTSTSSSSQKAAQAETPVTARTTPQTAPQTSSFAVSSSLSSSSSSSSSSFQPPAPSSSTSSASLRDLASAPLSSSSNISAVASNQTADLKPTVSSTGHLLTSSSIQSAAVTRPSSSKSDESAVSSFSSSSSSSSMLPQHQQQQEQQQQQPHSPLRASSHIHPASSLQVPTPSNVYSQYSHNAHHAAPSSSSSSSALLTASVHAPHAIQHDQQLPPESPSNARLSESKAAVIRLRKAYDNVTVNEVLTDPRIQLTPTTHKDVTLEWDTPPKTVLIIKKRQEPGLTELLRAMACWLQQEKGIKVLIEPSVATELPDFEAFTSSDDDTSNYPDIVICLGGDGTVLHANTLFQNSMPPVMAFSLGSLGFLTPFRIRKYKQSISGVLNQCKVTLRSRLFCIVVKHDSNGKECLSRRTVLNEVVVDRGYSPYLSNLECYCDNVPLTNIQADGIIVSSTTGSTAYSLSAGGSMVHPQMPAILFTPICPHSLSFRPLIFPDSVELKIQVPHDSRSTAWASFDGREQTELSRGDFLIIRVSKWPFVWIRESDGVGDWFKSLADCLHWNERRKQKQFGLHTAPQPSSTSSTCSSVPSPPTSSKSRQSSDGASSSSNTTTSSTSNAIATEDSFAHHS